MARAKEPKARAGNTEHADDANHEPLAPGDSERGHDEGRTKQRANSEPAPETGSTETTPAPPIYDRPQQLGDRFGPGIHPSREDSYASPLAATLFARFDPNNTDIQPSEHHIFVDDRMRQRGFI